MNQEQQDDWNAFRFIMVLAPAIVLIVAWLLGSISTALPMTAFTVAVCLLFAFRGARRRSVTLHLVMGSLITYQTVLLTNTVDEPNVGFVWFLIVPAVVALLGNRMHVLIWTPFALASTVYVWSIYRHLPQMAHPMTLPNLIGTTLVIATAAYFYIKQRQKKEADLTSALEAARSAEQDATEARQATTRFLGSMSHELRTPLTSIALSAEVLNEKLNGTELAHWPTNIQASSQSLLLLLNDILSLARSDAVKGEQDPAPFELADVLDSIRAIAYPLAIARRVNLFVGAMPNTPERWHGEENRLRQVLINLLNNALQHAEADNVWLLTSCREGQLHFVVGDDGKGIPESLHREIFRPFVRGPSGGSEHLTPGSGSGLGLAISGGYLKTMESTLQLESAPGLGSRFSFSLKTGSLDAAPVSDRYPAQPDWPKAIALQGSVPPAMAWARAWLDAWAINESSKAEFFFVADEPSSLTGSVAEFARQLSQIKAARIMPKPAPAKQAPVASMPKVLLRCVVCDDDTRIVDVLAARLKLAGHEATCFSTATEMLAYTENHTADVIILDLHLRNESGLDALREIRGREAPGCFVPICMLSGALDEREACLQAGADAYLFKPASGEELLKTIARIAEDHRSWAG